VSQSARNASDAKVLAQKAYDVAMRTTENHGKLIESYNTLLKAFHALKSEYDDIVKDLESYRLVVNDNKAMLMSFGSPEYYNPAQRLAQKTVGLTAASNLLRLREIERRFEEIESDEMEYDMGGKSIEKSNVKVADREKRETLDTSQAQDSDTYKTATT